TLISVFSACSKDDDSGNSYPKDVSVTYKVSSTTTNMASLIKYRNETGGDTDVPSATLPYSVTFDRTVNRGDVLSLGYGTNTGQTVKLEILVDNSPVVSQEFSTTSGAIVYSFQ
ncbi:MAG: hypothetical protein VXW38_08165, partial [Bacteroidota bacterium]|nr:hypothetical protein [Bacteroidota bacterium]